MKRPFLTIWFSAVILGALALPAFGGAPGGADQVCDAANTEAEERAAIFKENDAAKIMDLDEFQAAALIARLEKLGMPEAPEHDDIWVVAWPNGTASVALFRKGCRIAVANNLPFALLAPALVGTPALT